MACCTISYYGKVGTWTNAETTVILPDSCESKEPLPVLYFLHDTHDNHTTISRMTRLEWYAKDLPLVIVLPDGERGYYTDTTAGHAHEQLFIQDLMGFVEKCFPVRKERSGRAIAGIGMGGYGALKFALKYPDLFCSVTAHASSCNLGHSISPDADATWQREYMRIFGPNSKGGDNDIYALARRFEGEIWPALHLDCGIDDPLLDENRAFHEHLERLEIQHEYVELPGSHDWDYLDARLRDALHFHWKALSSS